jgi:hypothetical protein
MHREKYPEKIPFRLTRMLINAMEVSGIEGNFRFTCESVMRVLRDNRESVMAVLEAFVYDPLINWRLLQPKSPSDPTHDAPSPKMRQRSSSEQDGTRYSSRRTRLTAHTHTRAHAHSLTLNGVMWACAHTHAHTQMAICWNRRRAGRRPRSSRLPLAGRRTPAPTAPRASYRAPWPTPSWPPAPRTD